MPYRKILTREEHRAFADRLRAFRREYRLTQAELAAAMGVGVRTLGALERAEYAPFPSTVLLFADLVERYERARDMEMDGLVGLA